MKLHLSMLQKIISLPSQDLRELRVLLDDLGLEVKDIATEQDTVFNIETLANRGDHLHTLGVARELSARLLTSLKLPATLSDLPAKSVSLPAKIQTDKCLSYALLEMSILPNMTLKSEVASAMQIAGNNQLEPIVQCLNFVQMEIGQPMHAFDLELVEGEIIVNELEQDTEIIALDQKTYKVPQGAIVIRDRKKIIAVAGVIGLANSMVTNSTKKILVEAAIFDPVAVRVTAKKMGLSTDASYAFERGVDPEGILYALKRLAFVAQADAATPQSTGAHVLGVSQIKKTNFEKREIVLKLSHIRKQMNLPRLNEVEVTSRLKNLGYTVTALENDTKDKNEKLFKLVVPSWRHWDVSNQDDLLEDFVRAHSFNNVKLELPALDYEIPQADAEDLLVEEIEPILHGQGFCEVITESMYSEADLKILNSLDKHFADQNLKIANAVDSKFSHVRASNITHFVKLASRNLKMGLGSFKAYERCRFFFRDEDQETKAKELTVLTMACAGRWNDNEWRKVETSDQLLMNLKASLEQIFSNLNLKPEVLSGDHAFLHPGKQAEFKVGRKTCAKIGLVHPAILQNYDLNHDLAFVEIYLENLAKVKQDFSIKDFSEFPSIRRDLTLKLPAKDYAAQVCQHIYAAQLADLSSVVVVDDFKRDNEDFRRTSFRLSFQSKERTLESAQVDQAMTTLLEKLKLEHSLSLAE